MSSFFGGASRVASARQRSVSEPEPQSRIFARICSLEVVFRGAVRLPTRTELQRSITLSGAPCRSGEEGGNSSAGTPQLLPAQLRKLRPRYGERSHEGAQNPFLAQSRNHIGPTVRKPKGNVEVRSQPPTGWYTTSTSPQLRRLVAIFAGRVGWECIPCRHYVPACLVPLGF